MNRPTLTLPLSLLLACDSGPKEASPGTPKPAAADAPTAAASPTPPAADAAAFAVALAPVEISVEAAAKAKATEIRGRIEDGQMLSDDIDDANVEAMVWIAAQADDASHVAAALDGLDAIDAPLPEAAAAVVEARLRSSEPRIVAMAAQLIAGRILEQAPLNTNEAFIKFVASAATVHPNPGARIATAIGLAGLPDSSPHLALALGVLDAGNEPAAILPVLEHLQLPAEGEIRAQLATRAKALLAHPEPAIRGTAAKRLGQLGRRDDASTVAAVQALLKDDVPFVQCSALSGLGALGATSALAAVVAKLDDSTRCAYELVAVDVDGKPDKFRVFSGNPTVGISAALAIKGISFSTDKPLMVTRPKPDDAAAVKALSEAARTWAKAHAQG